MLYCDRPTNLEIYGLPFCYRFLEKKMNTKIFIKALKTRKYQPKEGERKKVLKKKRFSTDRPMFWHLKGTMFWHLKGTMFWHLKGNTTSFLFRSNGRSKYM